MKRGLIAASVIILVILVQYLVVYCEMGKAFPEADFFGRGLVTFSEGEAINWSRAVFLLEDRLDIIPIEEENNITLPFKVRYIYLFERGDGLEILFAFSLREIDSPYEADFYLDAVGPFPRIKEIGGGFVHEIKVEFLNFRVRTRDMGSAHPALLVDGVRILNADYVRHTGNRLVNAAIVRFDSGGIVIWSPKYNPDELYSFLAGILWAFWI